MCVNWRAASGYDSQTGKKYNVILYEYPLNESIRTMLRLEHLFTQGPTGILQDLSYNFDGVGNVLSIRDAVYTGTQSFQYDALDRLISATGASYGTQTFQYDAIGNMVRKGDRNLSYGTAGSRPHAVTSEIRNGVTRTFSYDANGNMTGRGTDSLQYDAENRLSAITLTALAGTRPKGYNKSTGFTYAYGFDGTRLKKISSRETRLYLADDLEVSGSLTIKAVFLGGSRVCEIERSSAGEKVRFFHGDHLGSSNVTTDALGKVVSVMELLLTEKRLGETGPPRPTPSPGRRKIYPTSSIITPGPMIPSWAGSCKPILTFRIRLTPRP